MICKALRLGDHTVIDRLDVPACIASLSPLEIIQRAPAEGMVAVTLARPKTRENLLPHRFVHRMAVRVPFFREGKTAKTPIKSLRLAAFFSKKLCQDLGVEPMWNCCSFESGAQIAFEMRKGVLKKDFAAFFFIVRLLEGFQKRQTHGDVSGGSPSMNCMITSGRPLANLQIPTSAEWGSGASIRRPSVRTTYIQCSATSTPFRSWTRSHAPP